MSTSANDDSGVDDEHGEILKASAPGANEIQVGMQVNSLDGEDLGRVKEVRESEFLLDRPMARDLWIPFTAVLSTEDYSGNVRGPVRPTVVVLEVSGAHVGRQGWRHA